MQTDHDITAIVAATAEFVRRRSSRSTTSTTVTSRSAGATSCGCASRQWRATQGCSPHGAGRLRWARAGHGGPGAGLRGGGPLAVRPDGAEHQRSGRGQRPSARPRGTRAQRARTCSRWRAGSVRSAFAMTEPAPGAGADPTVLATRRDEGRRRVAGQRAQVVHHRCRRRRVLHHHGPHLRASRASRVARRCS